MRTRAKAPAPAREPRVCGRGGSVRFHTEAEPDLEAQVQALQAALNIAREAKARRLASETPVREAA